MSDLPAAAPPLPDVARVLGDVLRRVEAEHRPLVVAIAERMAADRYRAWADERELAGHRRVLLACAAREERIASRVEALYASVDALLRDLHAKNPDLGEINRSLFAGRPLRQQLEIQAGAERLGAGTWRAFAAAADAGAAAVYDACAVLEEESAGALEEILGADR